jgi:hypothetical protein
VAPGALLEPVDASFQAIRRFAHLVYALQKLIGLGARG